MNLLKITGISLGLALLLSACDGKSPAPQTPPTAVVANRVQLEVIQPSQEFVGRTEASEDVSINSRVEGLLLSRNFTEGSDVKQGDILFKIDPKKYQQHVAQQSSLLKQREAAYSLAERNYRRGEQLVKSGAISRVDYDKLFTRRLEAKNQLEETQSTLEEAQLNLSYTEITAPISGRIGKALVSEGDLVTPERKLATLVQLDPIRVTFQISEAKLNETQQLTETQLASTPDFTKLDVRLRFSNEKYYDQTGHIDFFDNRVDAATGTLSLRASFANPNNTLLPGQFVKVQIATAVDKQAVLVPQQAVQEDQEGRFVMVVGADGTIEKRLLKLGHRYGVKWEVKSGLKAGESVVVEGLQRIRPGAKVKASYQDILPFEHKDKGGDGAKKPAQSEGAPL
ncbi:membrane fusion protein (multidrug efflux system) [Sinobacterium caligoides]|uniref:Membrane fusion protein (Multidrug efflux system) n=1 Tax=Sinobacterium caligoides TaxID=933926 RepID=A0A3N2DPT5_9GAMM|nr:efflux RND transporter periplasmic adaptor subunit [Sinobacterium caligoides]ROS01816.1 membrane fusion protein (multidrug efflux system) [Sinobacterium caligoides]